ncbi:MinD/ParA family ATP-binding protein [Glutamicibacter uratoxydans]|uniref:MinD/ParA family ATP-binding protein n=1 Tax=Glutamicibacter uratoxydans TaxID=43667 RepID=UPI003D702288
MSTVYTLTLNPTAYQLETPDGTSINAENMGQIEKILRSYQRNNPNETLHLIMDRTADAPWTINEFTVTFDEQHVIFEPISTKIDPQQRRQAVTLSLTGYAFPNGGSFTTFDQAINAGHQLAARNTSNGHPPTLHLVSDFPALNGMTIPALTLGEQPIPTVQGTPSRSEAENGLNMSINGLVSHRPGSNPNNPLTNDGHAAEHNEEHEPSTDATAPEPIQPLSTLTDSVEEQGRTPAKAPAESTPLASNTQAKNAAATFATRMENRKTAAAPAREGWRGTINRNFKTTLGPGTHEQKLRNYRAGVQKSLSAHRTLAMANIKGGAAKSTSVYLLGAVLGRFRGGNILYWDNNENAGNIVDRAIVPKEREVKAAVDLYQDIDQFENAELSHLLKRYVLMQGDNRFYLLPSQNEAGTKQVIDGAAFDRMYGILRRFYDLMLVDTGNASNSGPWEASIKASDAVIIASANAEDGFRGSLKTIDALEGQGYQKKLANAVVVFSEKIEPRYAKRRTKEFVQELRSYVRDVVVIPFDKALIHGGKIEFEALQPKTQEAYLQAAAAIVTGLR